MRGGRRGRCGSGASSLVPAAALGGESPYVDSNRGHAYVAGEGCNETVVLGACSGAEGGLMDSLLNLHGRGGAFG